MSLEQEVESIRQSLPDIRESITRRLDKIRESVDGIYWYGALFYLGFALVHGCVEDARYKHLTQQLDTIQKECYQKSDGETK